MRPLGHPRGSRFREPNPHFKPPAQLFIGFSLTTAHYGDLGGRNPYEVPSAGAMSAEEVMAAEADSEI